MGFEPTTTSFTGWRSTAELRSPSMLVRAVGLEPTISGFQNRHFSQTKLCPVILVIPLGFEPRFNAHRAHVLPLDEGTIILAWDEGFEPSTRGFGDPCSDQTELIPYCIWLRGTDSNRRPSGYGPDELPLLHPAILVAEKGLEPLR